MADESTEQDQDTAIRLIQEQCPMCKGPLALSGDELWCPDAMCEATAPPQSARRWEQLLGRPLNLTSPQPGGSTDQIA